MPNAERPARLPRAALKNSERRFRRRSFALGVAAVIRPRPLGRQLLAAEGAAAIENRATVLGGHTGAETMAASTHELAGLISTLHDVRPRRARFLFWLLLSQTSLGPDRQGAPVPFAGVYRENRVASQRGSGWLYQQAGTVVIRTISSHKCGATFSSLAPMTDSSRLDLCIVGAGALGIALARHARARGADVVLVDRGTTEPADGGSVALKLAALRVIAARAQAQRTGLALGLGGSEPKISHRGAQEWASEQARWWSASQSLSTLQASGIQVLSGQARFVDTRTIVVGETALRPRAVILAVGGEPQLPAVPGLGDIDVLTPERLAENARKLTHLLVIGGSEEGVSLAQTYRRLGSQVTLVPQGRLLGEFDAEAVALLQRLLVEEGIRVIEGGQVQEILPRSQGTGALVVSPDGSQESLDVSHVLVAMGRVPAIEVMEPALARLRPLRSGGYVAGPLGQTSTRFVRLVGDAAGFGQWHHALAHGRAVVDALMGSAAPSPRSGPRVVMTDPELVQIGRSSADAEVRTGEQIVRANVAEQVTTRLRSQSSGLAKVVVDRQGRVRAATMLGPHATELGAMLAILKDTGTPLSELADCVVPFPSAMSILCDLGDVYTNGRPVSAWAERLRRVRRIIPW